ncbi:conserved hypothetical protein [Trichinella spiralis]|uniref:hypothetical protein n=1 Tax=Trichinella spiralis TaxID=6334 RepID=UPI0001EFDAED|nr:conserved hypothetical protein [Trichinella spiralis]
MRSSNRMPRAVLEQLEQISIDMLTSEHPHSVALSSCCKLPYILMPFILCKSPARFFANAEPHWPVIIHRWQIQPFNMTVVLRDQQIEKSKCFFFQCLQLASTTQHIRGAVFDWTVTPHAGLIVVPHSLYPDLHSRLCNGG